MILGPSRLKAWLPSRSLLRFNSTASSKKYSDTLLLPTTAFPLRASAAESIEPFRNRTCEDLYKWQWENNKNNELFILHDGPPYANGSLHMGHALNKILKDIITRYRVLRGYRVHYLPGWDCHGLPIENKALEELGVKDSGQVPPETIRASAENTAKTQLELQKSQFRQFGIMADWDSKDATYRTMDHDYEMRQLRIFQKMVQNGLIYRNYRPVYFSPSSRSALAEAELEYKDDHVSHSVYVTFDITAADDLNAKLLVWTSTPWTLTANMGIAVNPEMVYAVVRQQESNSSFLVAIDRVEALQNLLGPLEVIKTDIPGTTLVGKHYSPLFGGDQLKKIVASSHVTPDSGTGLVHCAPAHGAEDYSVFRSQGLLAKPQDMICHVDSVGQFGTNVMEVVGEDAAKELIGKAVLDEGSRAVVDLIRQRGQLVKLQRYKHKYPYDWRTKLPVIVTATSQWFANLENVKAQAVDAGSRVVHVPEQASNRLQAFLTSRTEWCISRQRVWGVPIPSLHRVDRDEAVLDSASLDHILSILEQKGTDYWWNGPVEEFVPPHLLEQGGEWKKGTDTMDVWFDSGASWSMLRDLDLEGKEYRADVCLEGSDQHRGWFQSQLLTSLGAGEEKMPYKTLITHGMVLDEKGKKMSKSLGNVIDPLVLVNGGKNTDKEPAYGPDILRLWVATVDFGRDMPIGKTQLAQVSEAMRKIRNTARFALGNMGSGEEIKTFTPVKLEEMSLLDRYVLHQLWQLEQKALEGYESYDFPKVISSLNHFVNTTLSSLYFDINKDCLYADGATSTTRRTVVTVLHQILRTLTSILAPIVPHLAEEIHSHYTAPSVQSGGTSFFQNTWAPMAKPEDNNVVLQDMNHLLSVRNVVLGLLEQARRQKLIRNSLEAEVYIVLPDEGIPEEWKELLQREEDLLAKLFIVSDAALMDEGSFGTTSPTWMFVDSLEIAGCEEQLAVHVRPAKRQKCPRCWTFTKEDNKDLCGRCTSVVHGNLLQ